MLSLFLEELSMCHTDEFIMMFTDQAGRYKAKDLSISENMSLFWLPVYSPQYNPVEYPLKGIREKKFENTAFNSLRAQRGLQTI